MNFFLKTIKKIYNFRDFPQLKIKEIVSPNSLLYLVGIFPEVLLEEGTREFDLEEGGEGEEKEEERGGIFFTLLLLILVFILLVERFVRDSFFPTFSDSFEEEKFRWEEEDDVEDFFTFCVEFWIEGEEEEEERGKLLISSLY